MPLIFSDKMRSFRQVFFSKVKREQGFWTLSLPSLSPRHVTEPLWFSVLSASKLESVFAICLKYYRNYHNDGIDCLLILCTHQLI